MLRVSRCFTDDNTTVSLSYRNQLLTVSYAYSYLDGKEVVERQQVVSDMMNKLFVDLVIPYNITILFSRPDERVGEDLIPGLMDLLSSFSGFGIRVKSKYNGLTVDDFLASVNNQEVAKVLRDLPVYQVSSLDFKNSECLYIYDVYKIGDSVYKISDTFHPEHMYRGIITITSLRCCNVPNIVEIIGLVVYNNIVIGYKMPYYGVNIFTQHKRETKELNANNTNNNNNNNIFRLKQLRNCIKKIHENGYRHGDIMPVNVLVDSNLDVVVIDIDSRVEGMEDDWKGFKITANLLLGKDFIDSD